MELGEVCKMKKLLLPIDGTKRSLQTIDWVLNNYNAEEVSVTLMMVLIQWMYLK